MHQEGVLRIYDRFCDIAVVLTDVTTSNIFHINFYL